LGGVSISISAIRKRFWEIAVATIEERLRLFPKTYALTIIYNGFGNASLATLPFAFILR